MNDKHITVTLDLPERLAKHLFAIDSDQQAAMFELLGDSESAEGWIHIKHQIDASLDLAAYDAIPEDEKKKIDKIFKESPVCFGEDFCVSGIGDVVEQ